MIVEDFTTQTACKFIAKHYLFCMVGNSNTVDHCEFLFLC